MKRDDNMVVVSGYAITFGNTDLVGDVVMPGTFTKWLEDQTVPFSEMLIEHQPADRLGFWDVFRQDSRGLWVEGLAHKYDLDRHVKKSGRAFVGLSIGFVPRVYELVQNGQTRRIIHQADLYEISLSARPIDTKTTILIDTYEPPVYKKMVSKGAA